MSDIDLDKALDALADYADLVWDATDMQDKDTMAIARTQQELFESGTWVAEWLEQSPPSAKSSNRFDPASRHRFSKWLAWKQEQRGRRAYSGSHVYRFADAADCRTVGWHAGRDSVFDRSHSSDRCRGPALRHGERLFQRLATFERPEAGRLDRRAVRHRIGKRHAELDDVGPGPGQRLHDRQRSLIVGIAAHEIGDQSRPALGFQCCEAAVDACRHAGSL